MGRYRYFAHDDPAPPVGRSAYQRAKDCGFNGNAWGENIAWGYTTAQSVVSGWINSPGHQGQHREPVLHVDGRRRSKLRRQAVLDAELRYGWIGRDRRRPPARSRRPRSAASRLRSARRTGARLVARVTFVRLRTGEPVTAGQVRCGAEVDGHRLRVLANVFSGASARCDWSIPRGRRASSSPASSASRSGTRPRGAPSRAHCADAPGPPFGGHRARARRRSLVVHTAPRATEAPRVRWRFERTVDRAGSGHGGHAASRCTAPCASSRRCTR